MNQNVYDVLIERGYLDQSTNEEELKELLGRESVKFYVGFDATADSLTLGHFVQIMVMMHMQRAGHVPIALLGGGTTMIGDPSGRTDMRSMMTPERIKHNADCFEKQLKRFLDFSEGKAIIENNADWLNNLNFLEFMREIGVHFSVNRMLNFDCYKNRLNQGLTFFEFGYMLMQSYDFLYLYRKHGCKVQLGGSDQWSNIIGGYELIRKLEKGNSYGMTFKLLTTADGTKMGKSAKGAVWMDAEKTLPFEMFQYLRNVDDRDVEKFLLLLTFIPTDEVKMLASAEGSKINEAKERLAFEVVKLIHGEAEAKKALEASHALFSGSGELKDIPSTEISASDIGEGMGLLNMLTFTKLTASNSQARQLVMSGGIYINDEVVNDAKYIVSLKDFDNGKLLLRKGKKTYHEVRLID